ncbi:cation:proton antiporter [Streptomyces sp. NPDC048258]|uniref:cation:proton antiporter domain-containing protein n=1 Tax=Streptomyces sp. NPDC048258 TaxID=3365527 RepID=UPI003710B529
MTTVRTRERTSRDQAARPWILYVVLVVFPLAVTVVLLRFGSEVLGSGEVTGGRSPGHAVPDVFTDLLLALPVVLVACQLAGRLFRRISQPGVIGEILAGILLGPSVLGLVWPTGYAVLMPQHLLGPLGILAQLGLIFFMFLVGLELDLRHVRDSARSLLLISHSGVAVPMLAGIVLAFAMYEGFAPAHVGFAEFALFFGVSMSITAFPVLARIVADRNLKGTLIGTTALAGAAISDITAWCLLAAVVAIVQQTSFTDVGLTVALTLVFILFMWRVVRPALLRSAQDSPQESSGATVRRLPDAAVLSLLLCGIMVCALSTQWIGIHSIFGAFLLGAVMPRGLLTVQRSAFRIRGVTEVLLLPLFFVYSGLRTELNLLGTDWQQWAWCLLLIVVAVVVKWGSTTIVARATGFDWPSALSLGALMNCRGLTELIVLNVGLDLGVVSPALFTMFVLMALVSTVMTSPTLSAIDRWVGGGRKQS